MASLHACGVHQAPDPVHPDGVPGGDQVGVDPADPGVPAGGLMERDDEAGQRRVVPVPLRGAPVTPGVIPGSGHAQVGAHEGHVIQTLIRPGKRSQRILLLLAREPGRYFFCELDLQGLFCDRGPVRLGLLA